MVEIRVAVPDAAEAHGLVARLAELFGRSSVSFDGKCNQIQVYSEWESRSVVGAIDTVQSWLAVDGVDSGKLPSGECSCTMAGPALAQSEQAAAAAGRAA